MSVRREAANVLPIIVGIRDHVGITRKKTPGVVVGLPWRQALGAHPGNFVLGTLCATRPGAGALEALAEGWKAAGNARFAQVSGAPPHGWGVG
jgi:hypothetical protein